MKKLQTVDFANAETPILHDPGMGYEPGQLFIANDSRFLETYYSEPLTTYSVGWRDPNDIQATLDFVAPPVQVGRRFEWKSATNAEEFLSETVDDQRSIGSDFKRVIYTAKDVTDKTINKGLTYMLDLDNVPPNAPNYQNMIVAKLLRRLYRNEYRRAITALSAAATSSAVAWSTGNSANPDKDLRSDLITAATATGIMPNRVLYGHTAWHYRATGYENTASTTTAFANAAAMTPDAVAAKLMVDKVMISKERYQSAAAAKSEILGANVYAWYAQDGVDTEDPSNLKRFVSTFSPEQGGGITRVYVQQMSAKLQAITVEHYSKIVVTYTGGIRKWAVS